MRGNRSIVLLVLAAVLLLAFISGFLVWQEHRRAEEKEQARIRQRIEEIRLNLLDMVKLETQGQSLLADKRAAGGDTSAIEKSLAEAAATRAEMMAEIEELMGKLKR